MFHKRENVSRETFRVCDIVKAFTSGVSSRTVDVGALVLWHGAVAWVLELTYGLEHSFGR